MSILFMVWDMSMEPLGILYQILYSLLSEYMGYGCIFGRNSTASFFCCLWSPISHASPGEPS